MFKRNLDIREAKGKIPKWLIAERLGVHENTLNGWLRQELSGEKKQQILNVINQIKEEMESSEAVC